MTSIIAKRRAVHRQLSQQQQRNEELERHTFQLESLANLGSATAMIAHELNNLLTPLANYAELAMQNPEDRILTERTLRKTAQNCRHAATVMESILTLADAGRSEKVETPLLPLVKCVFDCLCRDFGKDSISVEILINDNLLVWAVPVQLQQALMNLIINAREAMLPKGGKLSVEASENHSNVLIKVTDTGCGIEKSEIMKIFDSFYSTKRKNPSVQTSGAGIGLALCKKVIDGHNGTITVESEPEKITAFSISLPKKPQA